MKMIAALAIAGAFLFSAPASAQNYTAYTPVVGDNTSALTSALATAQAANETLLLPCNTSIEVDGNVPLASNTHIKGCGYLSTTIQKGANTTPTALFSTPWVNCSTKYSNISFEDFTIDAQGSTQASNFYPLSFNLVSNVKFDGMAIRNPYSTLLYIGEPDLCGSGPGGKALQPNGQQYNSNVLVQNSIFDGTGQVVFSDLYNLLKTNGLVFQNNKANSGHGDCGAYEFDTNFDIHGNTYANCSFGIYMETSFNGSIHDNEWYGYYAPMSSNPLVGIWLADANQTYVGGGYNGTHHVSVYGNHFHDVQIGSGAENVYGIWVTGPIAPLGSNAINIYGNTCYNLNQYGTATGVNYCIQLSGTITNPTVVGNTAEFMTTGTFNGSGSYTAPGYAASNSVTGTYFAGNLP